MIFPEILLIISLVSLGVALMNIVGWPRVSLEVPQLSGKVSILIPARNEEANLPLCLEAAMKQGDLVEEILIYNDDSTDGTAGVIREYIQRDLRIRAVEPVPLEPGWCGKNFACYQLANAAKGNWLLFIDADARLAPGGTARMVAEMGRRGLTFLSCWPKLDMESFWERLLMPMLNFAVFSIFPAPLSLTKNRPSLGLAHGACLMLDRERYFEIGGHAAVKGDIFEDTRLARLWRRSGERGLCLDGQDTVQVRMYSSFPEIYHGFEKNFYPAFQRETSFWLFTIFHLSVYLIPFALLLIAPSRVVLSAVAATLLTRLVIALRFRHSLVLVLLHPISEAVLIMIGLASWWRCRSGKGVIWKGREYFSPN
jgi:chlorobactene glucosyltransferase